METLYFLINPDKVAMEVLLFHHKSPLMSTNIAIIVSDLLLSLLAKVRSKLTPPENPNFGIKSIL